MRALVFGGTGMIGQGLVLELVRDPGVTKAILVGRAASSAADPKIEQHTVRDLTDLAPIRTALTGIDACFWCLGISSVGLDEAAYRRITYEYTVAAAKQLIAWNPSMAFIFVSGASTDSSEKGAVMWARVKGAAENAILGMGFGRAHCVRPAFIQPSAGIRSRTAMYNFFYAVTRPLYPLVRLTMPGFSTTTEELGRAMIRLAREGHVKSVLEQRDMNAMMRA
jgi:uncharacterized protein YbjT (DUF2867 family)